MKSHGSTISHEPAVGSVPTLGVGLFVLVSPGIYTADLVGTPAASAVSDGSSGYILSDTDLSGTGRAVIVGGTLGVLR